MKNKDLCIQMLQDLQHEIALEMEEDDDTVHPLNMDLQNIINFVQTNF